jgi:hypothetical protein
MIQIDKYRAMFFMLKCLFEEVIDVRKMFGMKERFGSARKVLKAFRLISKKEDFPASSGVYPNQDLKRPRTFNLQAYTVGIQRMNEIEFQKAMTISLSRHEKWKAGGPV